MKTQIEKLINKIEKENGEITSNIKEFGEMKANYKGKMIGIKYGATSGNIVTIQVDYETYWVETYLGTIRLINKLIKDQ